jgi:DNA polymerase I-like protein with 3'-5' exonuclease and polymerase domains
VYFIGQEDLYNNSEYNPLYEVKSIEDCINWIKDKDSIALDTETEGFFNHQNRIIMLQLSDGKDVWVIDTRNNRDIFSKLKPYLESKLILGQNLKFDYKFLKFEGIELNNIYDTFLVECILTNGKEWYNPDTKKFGRKLGLGDIAKRYCNASLDKSIRNQFIGLNGQPFTHKQIVYGSEDVLYLHPIKEKQSLRADKYKLHEIIGLENKACLAIADIEYNGIKLDTIAWLKLADNVNSKLPEYEIELDNLLKKEPKLQQFINKQPQLDIFGGTNRDILVSWSSPSQVLKVFNILLGLKLESSSEKEIAKYQYDYPLIKRFIDYKKDAKLASTYGSEFIRFVNPVTKRVHGEFWQILDTFRVSCGGSKSGGKSSVNLQNLPAKNSYLNCFIAEKGKKIIGIDYKA